MSSAIFAQRTGLRSYFLIQTMQEWFSGVVYHRDSWDRWLERMRDRRDWRIKAVTQLAQLVVNGSRIYLNFLLKAGRWISTGFSRQMEFDADCREVAITGAEIFERTTLRMPILECAS